MSRFILIIPFLGLFLTLAFTAACQSTTSGESDDTGDNTGGDTGSNAEDDTDAGNDTGTDLKPTASCMGLGAFLATECEIPAESALQLTAGCVVMQDSLSEAASQSLLLCLMQKDCAELADQAALGAAFTACTAEIATDLPPSKAVEDFIEASCAYSDVCAGTTPFNCETLSDNSGGPIAILSDDTINSMADCIPDAPLCTSEQETEMTACIQQSLPLPGDFLGQL